MENMYLIRFVKDTISFPRTPRSPNLDVKWINYSRLKLTKINCQKMKTGKNDLKLGLCFHAILKMKTTSNGKFKVSKLYIFELGVILDRFEFILICRTWDMFELVHIKQSEFLFNLRTKTWLQLYSYFKYINANAAEK